MSKIKYENLIQVQVDKLTPPPPPKKNKLKNKTKMSKEKEIKLLSKKEIKKHIDSLPYYGHCTDEYREGVEDGIEWVKEQRLKTKR